ncbi:cupin domain-containing protein [Variovorax sp. JS1663]|uniref:cupin domain-containing protein n=1 Tax=Variovorax sp. JS1663 TaxID=1851577 RepID=UPI000B344F57|nr:cupin domain-containing protein [Variovorax sp. JS1663]OUM01747.1 hypothetical protein A8M77_14390 [Variovorax sp. JS1663]
MSANTLPAGLRPLDELDGTGITHFWGRGVCLKQTVIPKGAQIVQHRHNYAHLAYLVSGTVEVSTDSTKRVLTGPDAIEIPAGTHHGVRALTGAVWLCIHGTGEDQTPEAVDAITVAPINESEVDAIVRGFNEQKEG